MTYQRVIPRDLFNEANLLKCMGKLCLMIHDRELPGYTVEYDGEPFDIQQDDSDGSIYITNIEIMKDGTLLDLKVPLNSRRAWPLVCRNSITGEDEPVFDEVGCFELDGY